MSVADFHKKEFGREWLEEQNREEREKSKALKAYEEILNIKNYGPNAELLVKEVESSALNYLRSIDQLSYSLVAKEERGYQANLDIARKTAHDALISSLNALSRFCHREGIDNKWRRVVGLERTEVTSWVKNIAERLK